MIKFEGFQPRLGERELLSPLTFEVQPGEFVVISAPSGAGKTRLLESLLNQKLSHNGNCSCGGNIVSVPQSLNLSDQLTAWENVACARLSETPWWKTLLGFSAAEKKQAIENLAVFDFKEPEKKVSLLSGGERQRVALARLLNSKSRCWVLDEPVSALDENAARWCLENLRQIARERNAAVVCVLHHEAVADSIADRRLNWSGDWAVS